MAATSVLSPAQTPAVSSAISVTSGSSIAVALYTDTGVSIPDGVSLELLRQTITGDYQQVATLGFGPIWLSPQLNTILLNTPGTYVVKRPDITEFGVNVGVEMDS